MMNVKTTALHLSRQNVSRQLLPVGGSSSKNTVISLGQRTAQPANTSTNPVRFSSTTNSNRENNHPANQYAHHHNLYQQPYYHHLSPSSSFASRQYHQQIHPSTGSLGQQPPFPGSLAASIHFPKDSAAATAAAAVHSRSHAVPASHQQQQHHLDSDTALLHTELARNTWSAVEHGHEDPAAVFSCLQRMHTVGAVADDDLASRVVAQLLLHHGPKDAERALSLLVACTAKPGLVLTRPQKNLYASLADDIFSCSHDFKQALSLSQLLTRNNMWPNMTIVDSTTKTYRKLKSDIGLAGLRNMLDQNDVETLLSLQASLTRSNTRYRSLIEILLDAKEMGLAPSKQACHKVSQSFAKTGDALGLKAWDGAVQEVYPDYISNIQINGNRSSNNNNNSNNNNSSNGNSNGHNNHRNRSSGSSSPVGLRRTSDASDSIVQACNSGFYAVALETLDNMIKQNQVPTAEAIAQTIQLCAKKNKGADFNRLFHIAQRSLDTIQDRTQRRSAEYDVFNAMLFASANRGDMDGAKKSYDDIIQLGQFPDATSYAALLIATTTGAVDEAQDALRILEEVKRHKVMPNVFFYNVVIAKLARGRKIEKVLEVYEDMRSANIQPNSVTYGTLISACTRVGSEDMAQKLFNEMVSRRNYTPRHGPHNAMMQFYVRQKKDRHQALFYYNDMLKRRLVPTEHTYTLLIEAHASIAPFDMTGAYRVLDEMRAKGSKPKEAHYGAMIHAYGIEQGNLAEAERVYGEMKSLAIRPEGPALQAMMESVIAAKQYDRAIQMRNELVVEWGAPSSTYIENLLIRAFGLSNNVAAAETVFSMMADPWQPEPNRILKEPSTYSAMATAYIENGQLESAKAILRQMQNQRYPEMVIRPVEEMIENAVLSPRLESLPF
ncbi:hypothetical protein DFQ27_008232 [Actinomortierella ambigua]|uniref:PROP1-like PPR domain-containing protein n=1 Tax=Actinomortierella ambigua TaxID=1343610 RepID=A0A9P6PRQ8_9FUNG|nr:hypothetical protein DFQ27_008232 [Actinomortierella ambigua]